MLEFNATFLIAIVSFLIFMALMKRILYVPITKIIDLREKFFNENKEKQDSVAHEIEKLANDKTQKISKSKKEAYVILDKTSKEAKEAKEKAIIDAKALSARNFKKNEAELLKDCASAKDELSKELSEMAQGIIQKVLNKKTQANFTQEEINSALK